MPFGDGRAWVTPWKRIQPIPANEIGDTTAGSTSNAQTILDNVRRYRGNVANEAARDALANKVDGDWVLVRNDSGGNAAIQVYDSGAGSWESISGSGGGGGGGNNNGHGVPIQIGTGDGVDTTFTLPYTGANEFVWMDGALMIRTMDYTVAAGVITFLTAPPTGAIIIATAVELTPAEDVATTQFKGDFPTEAERPSSGLIDGDWCFVATAASGVPEIQYYTVADGWVQIGQGGFAVLGTPEIIGTGNGSTTVFTLPGTKTNEIVWKGGAIQLPGVDYTKAGGNITFLTAPATGAQILASCPTVMPTENAATAGGATGTPVVIGTGDGTTATFTLPYSQTNETVWKGGAVQVATTDYTKSGATITFVAGNIPAVGEEVVATAAVNPLLGTDALTLNGATATNLATANMIVQRRNDGTIAGVCDEALTLSGSGAADFELLANKGEANGYAELDATGKVPLAQLPPISNGYTVVNYTSGTSATLAATTTFATLKLASSAFFTFTLPTAASIESGHSVVIKDKKGDADVYAITVASPDSALIDGYSTFAMTGDFAAATFVFDGTDWNVI
jgi:hypothetical protein